MPETPNQSIDTAGFRSRPGSSRHLAHEKFPAEDGRPSLLDAIIDRAHRLHLFGVRYRPYWIMSDASAVAAIVYAWAFSRRFPSVSGLDLGIAFVNTLLAYKLVLELKAILGKTAARSFLQDCLLVIVPCFLLVSFALRQPMNLVCAFLGTLLPLYGCLAKVGCFLGGCCFGKPCSWGVLYSRAIFETTDHGCRTFSTGPDPGTRVFPIQLVEAAAQGTLFVLLAILVWQVPGAAGSIFWLYLSLYAAIRFLLDFFRTTSARPRYWRFSEAQLVCVAVQGVSLAILLHG
jgi:phosphatidylglycerol:prolipoprotein diacylglycerol transferase